MLIFLFLKRGSWVIKSNLRIVNPKEPVRA